MNIKKLEAVVEAILFSMGEAVEIERLAAAVDHDEDTVRKIIRSMMTRYDEEDRGIHLIELDGSFQLCTKPEMYEYLIKVAHIPKKHVLTDVLLETLSIVAYKQPITRLEIEKIRGVSCSHAVNKLVEYGLIAEAGRLDAPGKPILFGTTEEFLRRFGIQSLDDLPSMNPEQIENFKTEAEEEAQWMSDLLAGYPITYPVAYNCEGFQNSSSRQYGLSVDERSAIADAFLKKAEANGYTGMFYAARNELVNNTLWNTDSLELAYRIWVAQYGSAQTDVPEYPGNFAMWQYTNQGSVPGISTYVDLNVAYFGYSETAEAQEEGSAQHVEANPEVGVKFDEVSEQVTSKDTTNLRSTMDQGDDSNVVATLKNGETALRTGIGNNGWSRVEYNGEKLYAVSSYLTADLAYQTPVKEPDDGFKTQFTRVSENVTAKDVTNLRNRPSVEEPSEVIAQLHNGEVVVRTGVSDVGWSRVEYNGQILYCVSSYLQLTE